MPTTRTRVVDFTSGEFSEFLSEARVDIDQFYRSCRRLENMIVLRSGAAQRRPGTRWVAEVPGPCRLIRWEFSRTDSYVIAATNLQFRFFRNGGQIAVSGVAVVVATPYTTAELPDLDWVQSADSLFLVHPAHPVQRLDRLANDVWRLRELAFDVLPSFEYGDRPPVTLTPAAVDGTGITVTASSAYFLAADVEREIVVTAGSSLSARALIVSQASTTAVVDITEPFANLAAIAAGSWKVDTSPKTTCAPSAKDPVGASVTLTAGVNAFRATDIGKFALVDEGCFEITAFGTALSVTATIRSEATAITAAPSGAWTLEEAAFSALNGYPATTTFMGDRFGLGRTTAQPNSGWLAKSGDYFNFAAGALADDAIPFTFNSDQVNAIEWMRGGKRLLIGTTGQEYAITPAEGQVLTPNSFPISPETTEGSSNRLRPLPVKASLLFGGNARRSLFEFTFSFQVDRYVAPNLLDFADHLTTPRRINGVLQSRALAELAYQATPTPTVWAVRDDGTLLGMTYIREQNIVGWHRQITGTGVVDPDGRLIPATNDGQIASVAIIRHPQGDRDQIWVAVRRTIQGGVRHYIEYFDDVGLSYDTLMTDAAITYAGPPATVFSGLEHLEGKTVHILVDGAVYAPQVVNGGKVTLDQAASQVEIGLPFSSVLIPNRPEVDQLGTIQTQKVRIADGRVRVHRSLGATINATQLPIRSSEDLMGQAVEPVSEDIVLENLDDETGPYLTIRQDLPLPLTVLLVSLTLNIAD